MTKNGFTLFIFLLGSYFATGQIEWVGNHQFSEGASGLVQTAQNQYVLLHGNGITAFDSLGNIVFSDYLGSYHISEVVTTSDTSILLFADFFECDLIVSEIIKYDKDWNMQWTSPYAYEVNQVGYLSDSVIICADGNPVVQRFGLGSSGPPIWETYLGNGFNVNDICFSQEETILVCTAGGLAVLNTDGTIDTIFQHLKFGRLELDSQGFYYARIGDAIVRYSADFEPLDTFSTQTFHITDYSVGSDFLWLLTSEPRIIKLSNDLEEVASFPLSSQNETFWFITHFNDGFLIAGIEKYGESNHSNFSAFIKSYGMDGSSLITQDDVGVILVTMDEPTVKYNEYYGLLGVYVPYAITFHDIIVEVRNFGTTPVNRLNMNVAFPEFPIPFWCSFDQRYSRTFTNLNLQPSESGELSIGDLEIYFYTDPSGPFDFCMWTSLPDHHLDMNDNNDMECTEVLVNTSEPMPVLLNITFLPDSDDLYLHLAPEFTGYALDLTLFNVSGQMVTSETAFTGDRLNLVHLPDGLYIARVSDANGKKLGWGKVLKY